MRFSARTSWDIGENMLAKAIREAPAMGRELIDLTVSNPTVCGFDYDSEAILGALQQPASMTYDPAPCGILSARKAVAEYYGDHGAPVKPAQIALTTSTSEAYSFLFRLLCDQGEAVLAPQPSYPLFDFLADLDDVRLEPYVLFYDFGWWIDFAELERRLGSRTRALIVVHPNNPTGHLTGRAERERLEDFCLRHDLALIVDEVFLDYGLKEPVESFAVGPHPCLTFVVSGLSKIAALPQMKVGWIAVFGPEQQRLTALSRLEVIADTFLSMNAPAQHALPGWLSSREAVASQIRDRVRENLAAVSAAVEALPVEAGWSVILRLPQMRGAPDVAERLVRELGLVVHPGSFYGIPQNYHVVASLVTPVATLSTGIGLLNQWCESKELTQCRGA